MHSDYTHAGGLVLRGAGHDAEVLLVRPSDGSSAWVLPKGHIDPGEAPEHAAVREVREEAGVEATVREFLGASRFVAAGEPVRAVYYSMDWVADVPSLEDREKHWVPLDKAAEVVTYADAKKLVRRALTLSDMTQARRRD